MAAKRKYQRQVWTLAESEYLREHYHADGAAAVAAALGRPINKVYQRAARMGLAKSRKVASDAQIEAALGVRHPQGWSDAEIATDLANQLGCGVDRHRVGRIRRKLGLAANTFSEHRRRVVAAKTQEQIDASGLPSIGHLRAEAFNRWKRSLGWPETLTVRAVQALELFYQHGPMTRIQLCNAMGISSKKRTAPISNAKGGTVLAELQRAGLIYRLTKAVKNGGPYNRVSLYLLNPGVEPDEQRKSEAG